MMPDPKAPWTALAHLFANFSFTQNVQWSDHACFNTSVKTILPSCLSINFLPKYLSILFQDAQTLLKIINSKRIELEAAEKRKTSVRIRSRRSTVMGKKLSAQIAALEVSGPIILLALLALNGYFLRVLSKLNIVYH